MSAASYATWLPSARRYAYQKTKQALAGLFVFWWRRGESGIANDGDLLAFHASQTARLTPPRPEKSSHRDDF